MKGAFADFCQIKDLCTCHRVKLQSVSFSTEVSKSRDSPYFSYLRELCCQFF